MNPKILLIDDEKDITEALSKFLKDYAVLTAADGASGLAAAASARPELARKAFVYLEKKRRA